MQTIYQPLHVGVYGSKCCGGQKRSSLTDFGAVLASRILWPTGMLMMSTWNWEPAKAVQAVAKSLYRQLHRALLQWPERRSLTPIVRLWCAYMAPWWPPYDTSAHTKHPFLAAPSAAAQHQQQEQVPYLCMLLSQILTNLPATLMQHALSDHCSPYRAYLKTVHLSMLAAGVHPPTLLHAFMGNGCYMPRLPDHAGKSLYWTCQAVC